MARASHHEAYFDNTDLKISLQSSGTGYLMRTITRSNPITLLMLNQHRCRQEVSRRQIDHRKFSGSKVLADGSDEPTRHEENESILVTGASIFKVSRNRRETLPHASFEIRSIANQQT